MSHTPMPPPTTAAAAARATPATHEPAPGSLAARSDAEPRSLPLGANSWTGVVLRLVFVLVVVGGLTFAIHYYLWLRLVHDLASSTRALRAGTWAIAVLGAAIPTVALSLRALPPRVGTPLAWAMFLWMGVMFLLLASFGALDALRGIAHYTGPRLFAEALASRTSNLVAALFALASAVLGMFVAFRDPRLRRVTVRIDRLHSSQRGFRIVQWSDIHVGPTIGRRFIERLVDRTNALDPDLVVITGDLVDGPVSMIRDDVEPIRNLRARHGVYFITGNHEYISGVAPWLEHLPKLGLRLLRNERVRIGGDDGFDLAGVDDHMASRFAPGHGPDLARALDGRDPSRPLILLAHQPKEAPEASRAGVDLQLSGHTHGGQIFPFGLLVRLDQPLVSGLYKVGRTQVYVSEGTGYWGPPMRLGTRSELTEITLE